MNASLWQLAGWTMIHFLWIGALVAVLGGALRLACRRAAPTVRYAASLLTLAALAAAPLAIAAWLATHHDAVELAATRSYSAAKRATAAPPPSAAPSPSFVIPHSDFVIPPSLVPSFVIPHSDFVIPPSSPPSFVIQISDFVIPFVPYLPWAWLVGAPLTFLLLAAGLVGSHRLRRQCTPLTDGPAFDACRRLRTTLGVTCQVSLAACDRILQPVLIGIARPLILLPTAALAGWTPAELEMVLLHELAHVRRGDKLVNLVQRLVESLLFFHPAVWLASRQVRRDREECCDALVVARTDQPREYAELLVSIAATLGARRSPALAAASALADHPLAGRIRRILKLENEPMRVSPQTLAAALAAPLIVAVATLYAVAAGDEAQNPPPSKGGEQPSTVASGDRAQGGSSREAARGGIDTAAEPSADKEQPSTVAGDDQPHAEIPGEAADEDAESAVKEIAELERQVENAKKGVEFWDRHQRSALNGSSHLTEETIELLASGLANNDPKVQEPRRVLQEASQRVRAVMDGEVDVPENLNEQIRALREARETYAAALAKAKKAHRKQFDDNPDLVLETTIKEHARAVSILKEAEAELAAAKEQLLRIEPLGPDHASSQSPAPGVRPLRVYLAVPQLKAADTPDERLQRQRELLELVISPQVVSSVLQSPEVAQLGSVKAQPDAAAWLTGRLCAEFPRSGLEHQINGKSYDGGELLKMTLSGEAVVADDRVILMALFDVMRDAVYAAKSPADVTNEIAKSPPSGPTAPMPSAKSFPPDTPMSEITALVQEIERMGRVANISKGADGSIFVDASTPGDIARAKLAEFRYDGKTFDDWRSQWKHELKIERRIDAIEALAAFARAGYAEQAAEAILDVAGEYDFTSFNTSDGSPEGRLRNAIVTQLWSPKMPMNVWLSQLMERIAADQAKWTPLASAILRNRIYFPGGQRPLDADARALLIEMASDAKYGANADILSALLYLNRNDQQVNQLVKHALRGDDAQNALETLSLLGFQNLDDLPEQFDLLFHKDADFRRQARTSMQGARNGDFEAIASRLLKVLDDAERAADHADAIRALAVLQHSHSRKGEVNAENPRYSKAASQKVWDTLMRLLKDGPAELLPSVLVALGGDSPEYARSMTTGDHISAERQAEIEAAFAKYPEELKQATTHDE